MRKYLIILFVLYSLQFPLFPQEDENNKQKNIIVLANVKSNEVVLRWAPPDYLSWGRGNLSGYKVIRIRVNYAGEKPIEEKKIGQDTIKPFSLEQWKLNFPENHKYAPIAAQALYGKSFQVGQKEFDIANVRTMTLEQELRYSFAVFVADLDPEVANGLALRLVDKDIERDEQYLYAVIPYDLSFMDTGFVFVDTRFLTETPKAPELEKNEMENLIELRWNVENIAPAFTAYWIERSEDGRNWTRLNNTAYTQATQNPNQEPDKYFYFSDTTITQNYVPYKYRLVGITPFGELSEPSKIIEAMGRDKSAPSAPVITSIKDVNGKIEFEWTIDNPPADLKGFLIGKSSAIGGQYEQLLSTPLSPSIRKFVDSNPDPIGENYYVVFAVDTANNVSASMPAYGFLSDSIPPSKPIGLRGMIDTTGIVTLHWTLGKDPDITGYRVYFANAADHEFSNLTPYPIQDTIFIDTLNLNTLTKEINYQIAAVDRNFNHSEKSEILKLIKPDIVPPTTPLISKYFVTDTAVILNVIPSSSDDVAQHILYRKGDKQNEWSKIKEFLSVNELKYQVVDNQVIGPNYYQYSVQAIDSAGNKSELSSSVGVRVYKNTQDIQIDGLTAQYNQQSKSVNIRWNKPKAEVSYYVIYRKVNQNKYENFASVDANKNSFEDREIILYGEYQYGIKAIYKNGESKISLSSPVIISKQGDDNENLR